MANQPPDHDTGTPRWVNVFGIIFITLVVLIIIMLFIGDGLGDHGPGRHDLGEHVPPIALTMPLR